MISALPDRTLVLDGGLATELERRGHDLRDPLWSARLLVEDPSAIVVVHRAYFEAGAQVAITASYQASFEGFAARGIGRSEAADLLRLSVALAREAGDAFRRDPAAQPLVAASIGPYGAALADGSEYRGDYGVSEGQLEDFHGPRLELLAAAGADLLAIETIPSLAEADCLLRLLRAHPHARAWFSFTCRDEAHVAHGETLVECVAHVATSPQVLAVGLNCTAPRLVEDLLRAAGGVTSKPLVAYPNRGERWDASDHRWRAGSAEAESPADFARLALRWHAAGARLIGGCCRTGPEHIRAIRQALEAGAGRA